MKKIPTFSCLRCLEKLEELKQELILAHQKAEEIFIEKE